MEKLISLFALDGEITSIAPLGNGHINSTYKVTTPSSAYVFQYINANVFPDVEMLMNNIEYVTEHLREKGVKTLEIVKTKTGALYVKDGERYLRGYRFIENSVCYEALPTLEMVQEAARGFGDFHRNLSDIDITKIGEVIKGFHDTRRYFASFKKQVEADPRGRKATCLPEIEFLLSREKDYSLLMDALEKGEIARSVTHNDPKINNVAFDAKTGKVSCILDLDTVMPGTFLFDFGDGLRSLFTGDNEDNEDTSKLVANLPIYEAYLDGYYSMMKDVMNEKEIALLPLSIQVIAEELSLRFLGDYLAGDVYFGVAYSTHNLVRARTQIALAKDIIAHMDELKAITERIVKKYA